MVTDGNPKLHLQYPTNKDEADPDGNDATTGFEESPPSEKALKQKSSKMDERRSLRYQDYLSDAGFEPQKSGNKYDEQWNLRYDELVQFKKQHANANSILHNYSMPLYNWVRYQMKLYSHGTLSKERTEMLERLKFDFGTAPAAATVAAERKAKGAAAAAVAAEKATEIVAAMEKRKK